jgi:hypothetical protein
MQRRSNCACYGAAMGFSIGLAAQFSGVLINENSSAESYQPTVIYFHYSSSILLLLIMDDEVAALVSSAFTRKFDSTQFALSGYRQRFGNVQSRM